MNDTTPEVQAELRRRMAGTDVSRRLRMLSGMLWTARALGTAGLGSRQDAVERRIFLFRRTYGIDFSAREVETISAYLRAVHAE